MAKIKLTKTELKAQREALERFRRFLPMLQLKKSQLQAELALMRAKADDLSRRQDETVSSVASWVGLLADERAPIPVVLRQILSHEGNIAGVSIPVYDGVETDVGEADPYETPEWVDDAARVAQDLIALRAEREIALEQVRRVAEELRTTSQRVNLFEKVKIPECLENIRVIQVALGDERTSAVARGKIAKNHQRALSAREEPA